MADKQNRYFFIAGNPVSHSLSPVLFNAHATGSDFAGQYVKALCTTAKDIDVMLKNGFSGGNITAPLKEKVLSLVFKQSEAVRMINAANTIYEKNGEWFFENTDINGVRDALQTVISELRGLKAVVLGAGGAGRAAAFALKESGCHVTIINRSVEKAIYWANRLDCTCCPFNKADEFIRDADLIVNTISENHSFFNNIQPDHIVLDADYKTSPLKAICQEKGATYISGLLWLVHQAIPAFEQLTGVKVNKDLLLKTLESEIAQVSKNNFIITGMMKSGKTTIGKLLARKLHMQFTDTDRLIEQLTEKTIKDIFEAEGEARFRYYEKEAFRNCCGIDNQVIATGGGLVLDKTNRDLMKTCGTCFFLFASPELLASRHGNEQRPLLQNIAEASEFKRILTMRLNDYVSAADLVVVTDGKSVGEIAGLIKKEVGL